MSDDGLVPACLASSRCFVRGLPLFLAAAPRTPLRVLGIIALDTLHLLRHSRPMPRQRVHELATFLDFEGCANAAWDHKETRTADYHALRQRLQVAGHGPLVADYLGRLGELERRRPAIGGDRARFDEVRGYREGVAWLSLATAAAMANGGQDLDEAIHATGCDGGMATLLHILMQCQIVDDVIDYEEDWRVGLPSFLTATASLAQAMELTGAAANHYARGPGDRAAFPLRLALAVVTAGTRIVIHVAERMRRHTLQPMPALHSEQARVDRSC